MLGSTFTPDPQKVNVEKRIFQEDAELSDFLQSGLAATVYIRHVLMPYIERNSPEECTKKLLDPPQDQCSRPACFSLQTVFTIRHPGPSEVTRGSLLNLPCCLL